MTSGEVLRIPRRRKQEAPECELEPRVRALERTVAEHSIIIGELKTITLAAQSIRKAVKFWGPSLLVAFLASGVIDGRAAKVLGAFIGEILKAL